MDVDLASQYCLSSVFTAETALDNETGKEPCYILMAKTEKEFSQCLIAANNKILLGAKKNLKKVKLL